MGIVPSDGVLAKLYEDAFGREEYKASAFWQVFLQRVFHEESYIVVCEAAPTSNSRRRVDIVVRHYDRDHHTLSSLIFNECKKPSGSRRDAEEQVIEAANLAISNDHLTWVYVMTTVGTTFRLGMVMKDTDTIRQIGDFYMITQYVDADSDGANELWEAISYIKRNLPLTEANVLPSNAPLGLEADVGQYGVYDDDQATKWTPSLDGAASSSAYISGPDTSEGNLYDNNDVEYEAVDTMASIQPPAQVITMSDSDMIDALFAPRKKVRATYRAGLFGPGKVYYKDENGNNMTTDRHQWTKMKSNGFEVYVLGRRYYSKHL